jgi:hypothetical protein
MQIRMVIGGCYVWPGALGSSFFVVHLEEPREGVAALTCRNRSGICL